MRPTRYFVLLGIAGFMWAAQGTAVKFLNGHLGPVAITFLPLLCTTVLLIPLLIREWRRNPQAPRLTPRDWKHFAIAGVFGQVPAQLGMTWGITRSLASNGAILNLLVPVISAVFASIILRVLAVCMYGASMLLFFHALKHLDVVVASMSLYLVPVFGVALGITILDEHLRTITIGGAALVVGSAALMIRNERSAG